MTLTAKLLRGSTAAAIEALQSYGAALALKHERFAAIYDCAVEDAEDVRDNMGQNALARALAVGMTEERAREIIIDAEAAQLRVHNPWENP